MRSFCHPLKPLCRKRRSAIKVSILDFLKKRNRACSFSHFINILMIFLLKVLSKFFESLAVNIFCQIHPSGVSWTAAETRLLVKSLQLYRKDFSRIQKAVSLSLLFWTVAQFITRSVLVCEIVCTCVCVFRFRLRPSLSAWSSTICGRRS